MYISFKSTLEGPSQGLRHNRSFKEASRSANSAQTMYSSVRSNETTAQFLARPKFLFFGFDLDLKRSKLQKQTYSELLLRPSSGLPTVSLIWYKSLLKKNVFLSWFIFFVLIFFSFSARTRNPTVTTGGLCATELMCWTLALRNCFWSKYLHPRTPWTWNRERRSICRKREREGLKERREEKRER